MSSEYFGRGSGELYGDYIDFINYVFGFDGHNENFSACSPNSTSPVQTPRKLICSSD